MLEIFLIRHGQTDWNRERRIMGDKPIALNSTGKAQVKALAEFLRHFPIDHFYTSPLRRTLETAEILNEGRALSLVQKKELREVECGQWVGKTFYEVSLLPGYVDYYEFPNQPVGVTGESLKQLRERSVHFVEELRSKHRKGKIVLVSHADWIKCLLMHYLKMPLQQLHQLRIDNASLSHLVFEDGKERVISINQNIHLAKIV